MLQFSSILADSDDAIGKIIVGVIVFIIWGIGALANMMKKTTNPSPAAQAEMERAMREQVEEARRRQAAMALEAMNPPMPPPMIVPSAREPRRGPAVPPMRNIAQMPLATRIPTPVRQQPPAVPLVPKQKKQKQRRTPAAPAAGPWTAELPQDTPGVIQSAIGQGSTPASPARRQATQAAATPAVARLTPAALRQQFILTEILQKPLALRDDQ